MTSTASFVWFWQPPIASDPGLLMIQDRHPGPERPDVPFVLENLGDVLQDIETHLPKECPLDVFRIFVKNAPFRVWVQIKVAYLPAPYLKGGGRARRFYQTDNEFSQAALSELWEARER